MNRFAFAGRDQRGKPASGTVEASDHESALKMLSDREIMVTNLSKMQNGKVGGPVSREELLAFTQELSSLLEAGITIKRGLSTLATEHRKSGLGEIANEMSSGISAGVAISDLMRHHPSVFSKFYVTMVSVGERSGELASSLSRVARYLENAENLKNKIKAALYYPGIVLTVAGVIMLLIITMGIPRIESIYGTLGATLPLPTRILIHVSGVLSHDWPFIAGLCAAAYGAIRYGLKTDRGQFFWDSLKLRLPFLGSIYQRLAIARFARTLGILYASGVPILPSLELIAEVVENRVMERAVVGSLRGLKEGRSVVEPLRDSNVFTPMSITMLAAGEESSTLDRMADRVADFYEAQVDGSLKALSGVLEPVVLVGIGLGIAFIILALGLPFMNLVSAIHAVQ